MKKIAICTEGVLRNKFEQFDKVYRKRFIKNESLVGMTENFEVVEDQTNEDEDRILENLINKKIHLPITTYDLMNHYDFPSTEVFEDFIQNENAFEIFGTIPALPKAIDALNRIQALGEEVNLFETHLVTEGREQIVTATLHFLLRSASRIKNITFRKYDENLWNMFDLIVTDCPEILDSCPEGKTAIKISKDYNLNSKAKFTFLSLGEFYDALVKENMF